MQNLVLLRNMILMARADGHLDESELQMLEAGREKWGVSESDFARLLEETKVDDATIYVPESPSLRHDLLVEMALMMMADGQIHPNEQALLENAARRMGVRDDELQKIIDEYSDRDDDLVLGEE